MAVLLTIARWLLVLPGSVLAGWIVGRATTLAYVFFYRFDPAAQTIPIWNAELVINIAIAWAEITAGIAIAPRREKRVGYTLAVLYSGIAWLCLLAMSQTECMDCWDWMYVLHAVARTVTLFIVAATMEEQ